MPSLPKGPAIADKSEGDFSGFSAFSVRFPGFRGWGRSGRVREPIFMPRNRFFIIKSSFEKVKKSSFYTIEKWS